MATYSWVLFIGCVQGLSRHKPKSPVGLSRTVPGSKDLPQACFLGADVADHIFARHVVQKMVSPSDLGLSTCRFRYLQTVRGGSVSQKIGGKPKSKKLREGKLATNIKIVPELWAGAAAADGPIAFPRMIAKKLSLCFFPLQRCPEP